jgi:glycerophosphoryl diester phosphodiesterase
LTAILAHRGASADHPENTLRAFRRALVDAPAADGFECDVRLSTDGVPFVFHDDDTERLTGQTGTLEARTSVEISALRVGGEPIPTLADLLALVDELSPPPLLLNVELKPTGDAAPLIAACRPLLDGLAASSHSLIVSSFDPRVLATALDAQVPWRLAFLYETLAALRFLDLLAPRGPLDLHPHHALVDADHLARYASSPRRVRTWTVDDPDEARRLIDLGVDALITNAPQRLKRSLLTP